MRVATSRVQPIGAALAAPVGNARARWSERAGLLVTLTDDAGRVGRGEASPLPGFSPDTLADCALALDAVHRRLGPLGGRADDLAALERLALPPAARFAVETALLDLVGQRTGRSLAACLAGGAVSARVPVAGLLPATLDDLAPAARARLARGVRTLKVKVGRAGVPFAREVEALSALRRAVGDDVALRLDANGAWDAATARRHLAAVRSFGVELVEEPAAGEALCALGACAVPWAADESLADPALAERLLAAPGCAAVVLKPALLGLAGAWSLARRARARGLGVVVSHLFDGPVALAAACELALAVPGGALACGLDPHDALAAFPPWPVPQLATPGWITPSGRAGLGVRATRQRGVRP